MSGRDQGFQDDDSTRPGRGEPEQVPVGPPDGATAAGDATRTGTVAAASGTDAAGTTAADDGADHDARFFGQPWALAHIFGVEMWERFSFYGMQGILLIYMYYSVADGGLGIPEATATGIVGAYGGAVYLSTILGAWVADRLLGSERVLFFSAWVIMAGHIALALLPERRGGRRRPHARRRRIGRAEGERDRGRRHALLREGPAPRCRLLAVLPRHQPRRVPRADRSPGSCRATWGSTGASRSPRSAWRSASSSTPSAASSCRAEARVVPNPLPANRRGVDDRHRRRRTAAHRRARADRRDPCRQPRRHRDRRHARRGGRLLRRDHLLARHHRRPSARGSSASSRCSS